MHHAPSVCIHKHRHRNMHAHVFIRVHTAGVPGKHLRTHAHSLYKYPAPMHNGILVTFSVWDSIKEPCSGLLPGTLNIHGRPFPSITPSWSQRPLLSHPSVTHTGGCVKMEQGRSLLEVPRTAPVSPFLSPAIALVSEKTAPRPLRWGRRAPWWLQSAVRS